MKFSILFVCGKWAKPHIRNTKNSKGLCLGWFAITLHPKIDLEELISMYVKDNKTLPKELSNIAYTVAKGNNYEGFVNWWDEQKINK